MTQNMTLPKVLFVQTLQHCNMRCLHCQYWQSRPIEGPSKLDIITEFATLNPNGIVDLCTAGESLLDKNIFNIFDHCQSLDLHFRITSNGFLIDNIMADKLLQYKKLTVSISLDSHIENLHDTTRGIPGTYNKATKAIKYLADHNCNIHVSHILYDKNYTDLKTFCKFIFNDLGAKKLFINFLQPTFNSRMAWIDPKSDPYLKNNTIKDPAAAITILKECNELFKLGYDDRWFNIAFMYLDNILHNKYVTDYHMCNSYDRNIMINIQNDMKLCFNTAFDHMVWKKIGDLKFFWENSDLLRQKMNLCNKLCSISNCTIEEKCQI